jgi:hypothetical protein
VHRPSLAVDVDGGSGAPLTPTSLVPEPFISFARPLVIRPIRMAPLAVVAVTLPSARSMSKSQLPLLRSRSAAAWPIQLCPPEFENPTVPLTSPIRIANARRRWWRARR